MNPTRYSMSEKKHFDTTSMSPKIKKNKKFAAAFRCVGKASKLLEKQPSGAHQQRNEDKVRSIRNIEKYKNRYFYSSNLPIRYTANHYSAAVPTSQEESQTHPNTDRDSQVAVPAVESHP